MKPLLIEEYDLVLAGTQYQNRFYNAEGSRKGTKFDLVLEKDNPFDPLAIKVLYKGKDIGYIPMPENSEVAYYINFPEQFKVECKQKKKQDNYRYTEMIVVDVYVYALTENYQEFNEDNFNAFFPNYDNILVEIEQKREEEKQREKEKQEQQFRERKQKENKEAQQGCLIIIGVILAIFVAYKGYNWYKDNEREKTKYYINSYCYHFDIGLKDSLLTKHTDTLFKENMMEALEKGYYEYYYAIHNRSCDSSRIEVLNYKNENIEPFFNKFQKDSIKMIIENNVIETKRLTDSLLNRKK